MSSAVVSTSAALGRPFVFESEADLDVGTAALGCPVELRSTARDILQSTIKNQQSKIPSASVTPASQLNLRPAPEMVPSGVPAIDALTGGLPRGCLTEICGPASSGRTTILLAALAAATRRAEFCAVVDASDALDPQSAAAAGVELDRLLWVRCGEEPPQKNGNKKTGCPISRAPSAREVGAREVGPEPVARMRISSQSTFNFDHSDSRQSERCLEQVLRATDLLLESGGFGLIVLDLGDLPPQAARRIPLTTWFRFRRAIEHTPTMLLAIEPQPIAGSCSSLLLQLGVATNATPLESEAAAERRKKICTGEQFALDVSSVNPTHAHLLTGLNINAELIRSRLDRKPARSIAFASKTAWAG